MIIGRINYNSLDNHFTDPWRLCDAQLPSSSSHSKCSSHCWHCVVHTDDTYLTDSISAECPEFWDPFTKVYDVCISCAGNCPAFEPFRCPEENRCISIQVKSSNFIYMCHIHRLLNIQLTKRFKIPLTKTSVYSISIYLTKIFKIPHTRTFN